MNGFDGIISQLEAQRSAIEKALEALREAGGEVSGGSAPAPVAAGDKRSAGQKARWAAKKAAETPAPASRKGGMTPEGKARLVAALKKRWAAKKRAAKKAVAPAPIEAAPVAVTAPPAPARRKGGGMTEEGRKKLAAAMRKRWAVAKAAGTTPVKAGQKAGRKKAA